MEVTVKNVMFNLFHSSKALQTLVNSESLDAVTKFKLYKLIKVFSESTEFDSFTKAERDLKLKYAKKDENGDPITIKDDTNGQDVIEITDRQEFSKEMLELYNMDSGLTITKPEIKISALEKANITVNDMLTLDWLIDFIE